MNDSEKIIHFELNNWFSGRDYPDCEPFKSWIKNNTLSSDEWAKENKLVIGAGTFDMSMNWLISARESWVKENCPILLSNEEYSYTTIMHDASGTHETTCKAKYSQFLREPDEDGDVYGKFDWKFPEYSEENYGVHYIDEMDYWDDEWEDEDEDDDDED